MAFRVLASLSILAEAQLHLHLLGPVSKSHSERQKRYDKGSEGQ